VEKEFEKYNDLAIQNLVFEINGITDFQLDNDTNKNKIEQFENYLEKFNSFRLKRLGYFILVELTQNAYRHGISQRNYKIIVGKFKSELIFMSVNLIFNQNKVKLIKELDKINLVSDNIEKLKEYYKSKISEGAMCYSMGSSGLGIIDLARKSGKKLLYHFTEINISESIFSLIVRIDLKKDEKNSN